MSPRCYNVYTKIQPQSFPGSWEEDFKCFYLIWARHLSCSVSRNHLNKLTKPFGTFEQTGKPFLTGGLMRNLVKIAQAVLKKKTFKNYTILYMYIAQGQGQITPRGQNLDYNIDGLLLLSLIAISLSYILRKWLFNIFPIRMHVDAHLTLPLKRSKATWGYHLNKLGRSWVHDAIYMYQDSALKLSWFWRRRFQSVFTIYGHGGHLD